MGGWAVQGGREGEGREGEWTPMKLVTFPYDRSSTMALLDDFHISPFTHHMCRAPRVNTPPPTSLCSLPFFSQSHLDCFIPVFRQGPRGAWVVALVLSTFFVRHRSGGFFITVALHSLPLPPCIRERHSYC